MFLGLKVTGLRKWVWASSCRSRWLCVTSLFGSFIHAMTTCPTTANVNRSKEGDPWWRAFSLRRLRVLQRCKMRRWRERGMREKAQSRWRKRAVQSDQRAGRGWVRLWSCLYTMYLFSSGFCRWQHQCVCPCVRVLWVWSQLKRGGRALQSSR